MSSIDDIKTMVISALGEATGQELSPNLPLSTGLYSKLNIDSMDAENLIMLLEDDFDLIVDQARFAPLTTLGEVVNLLYELQSE